MQIIQEQCQEWPYRVPEQQVIASPGSERATYRLQFAFSGRCLGIAGERAVQTACDDAPDWMLRTAGAAAAALPLPSDPDDQQWRTFRIETTDEPARCVIAADHNRKDLVDVVPCAPDEHDSRWPAQVWCIPDNARLPAALGA
ncbi:hypothetical protein [Catenuloplanes indicus]|uniref:Ricin B lectin domain-containing protein n=1 Tax=Catenuloplanes indicus TaxID=137267 RepID=A0AAE4AVN6_9ACTN|nr:hypothetical protein [Catenuloplanes indicus]MDQ0365100.1 hypothetical protein [Catenuloplanes indicus]